MSQQVVIASKWMPKVRAIFEVPGFCCLEAEAEQWLGATAGRLNSQFWLALSARGATQ